MIRLFDFILASLSLAILSPFLLLVVFVLLFTGEGEVFFRQRRVGLNGKYFGLYKFATMVKNSESIGTGTVTIKNDPRILPVGRVLRKTKVNELPQIINIITGDMSIIGPRPQDKRCFEAFPKEMHGVITSVQPGLSGIGSIIFRNEEEIIDGSSDPDAIYDDVIMPYKADLEEWFVSRRSLSLYFQLIFITAVVVLYPKLINPWRWFEDLPTPPDSLKKIMGYNC